MLLHLPAKDRRFLRVRLTFILCEAGYLLAALPHIVVALIVLAALQQAIGCAILTAHTLDDGWVFVAAITMQNLSVVDHAVAVFAPHEIRLRLGRAPETVRSDADLSRACRRPIVAVTAAVLSHARNVAEDLNAASKIDVMLDLIICHLHRRAQELVQLFELILRRTPFELLGEQLDHIRVVELRVVGIVEEEPVVP